MVFEYITENSVGLDLHMFFKLYLPVMLSKEIFDFKIKEASIANESFND